MAEQREYSITIHTVNTVVWYRSTPPEDVIKMQKYALQECIVGLAERMSRSGHYYMEVSKGETRRNSVTGKFSRKIKVTARGDFDE